MGEPCSCSLLASVTPRQGLVFLHQAFVTSPRRNRGGDGVEGWATPAVCSNPREGISSLPGGSESPSPPLGFLRCHLVAGFGVPGCTLARLEIRAACWALAGVSQARAGFSGVFGCRRTVGVCKVRVLLAHPYAGPMWRGRPSQGWSFHQCLMAVGFSGSLGI